MLQDIDGVFDNTYRVLEIEDKDFVLYYKKGNILARNEEEVYSFPTCEELCLEKEEREKCIYGFAVDGEKYFIYITDKEAEAEGCGLFKLRGFERVYPRKTAFTGVAGGQLYRWYTGRRFCGKCGGEMVRGKNERMLSCKMCGSIEFPKISPAVIVGITNGDKILMTKYAGVHKHYALVAGFCELGETFEDTVRREVLEEVGLKVKNITYYKSQPWSVTDTLLAGFFCEVDGDDAITMDEGELSVAGWYSKDEIPESKQKTSLTSEMMEVFKNKK